MRLSLSAIGLLCLMQLSKPMALCAATPQEVHVKISGFKYSPTQVTIKKGGKVVFTNDDSAPHTVTPEKGAAFAASGRMLKNESKTVVFNTAGLQHYFCEIHPSMKGTVNVVP